MASSCNILKHKTKQTFQMPTGKIDDFAARVSNMEEAGNRRILSVQLLKVQNNVVQRLAKSKPKLCAWDLCEFVLPSLGSQYITL